MNIPFLERQNPIQNSYLTKCMCRGLWESRGGNKPFTVTQEGLPQGPHGADWQLTRTRGQEEEGTSGPIGKKSMLCLEKKESKSGRLELRAQHGGSGR